jgi:hypothetical protein
MRSIEHHIAVAVMNWWAYACKRYKLDEKLLHAIPNGGQRNIIVASKLKAEGVRAGVSDYFLAVPRRAFHGLYLELKAGGGAFRRGALSKEQAYFGALVVGQGYEFKVAYGTEEAIEAVENYLGAAKGL